MSTCLPEQNKALYPFKNPMWFIIDSDLHLPFLKSLVGIRNSDSEKLLSVLEEITSN